MFFFLRDLIICGTKRSLSVYTFFGAPIYLLHNVLPAIPQISYLTVSFKLTRAHGLAMYTLFLR